MAKAQKMQHSKKAISPKGRDYLMKILTYQQNLDYLVGWGMRSAATCGKLEIWVDELMTETDESKLYRMCVELATEATAQRDAEAKRLEAEKAQRTADKKEVLKKEDTELRAKAYKREQEKRMSRA